MKSFLFFISLFVFSVNLNINVVRNDYKAAAASKTKANLFNDYLKGVSKKDDKRLVAYKGAAITLIAKHKKGIIKKTLTFKEGIEWIEFAIKKEPLNIEIRFVRLSIQQNSPKLLGYNKNIKGDKNFILKNFKAIKSNKLKKYLRSYIIDSNKFTQKEKSIID